MTRQKLLIAGVLSFFLVTTLSAATLRPESLAGWLTYIAATEKRMALELVSKDGFLGLDFESRAGDDRRALAARKLVIRKVETRDPNGRAIDVPRALVHHWRGAVLIPHHDLTTILATLESRALDVPREDVLQAAVLSRGPGTMKVFLQLRREKIVTVVYNTEHDVAFTRYGPSRASSVSTATKDCRTGRARHAARARAAAGAGPRLSVAMERLLAIRAGQRGRHRRVRVRQPEPRCAWLRAFRHRPHH